MGKGYKPKGKDGKFKKVKGSKKYKKGASGGKKKIWWMDFHVNKDYKKSTKSKTFSKPKKSKGLKVLVPNAMLKNYVKPKGLKFMKKTKKGLMFRAPTNKVSLVPKHELKDRIIPETPEAPPPDSNGFLSLLKK